MFYIITLRLNNFQCFYFDMKFDFQNWEKIFLFRKIICDNYE